MKTYWITISMIAITFQSCIFERKDCHKTINLINNSSDTIYFEWNLGYPDTTISSALPQKPFLRAESTLFPIQEKSILKREGGKVRCWDYVNVPAPTSYLYRGFTGHEHLTNFNLINMNGRMYDPVVGRVLSVDNYVQDDYSMQGYNRYSYVMNNPLVYTDPDGQWVHIVIGAAIGGFVNFGIKLFNDPANVKAAVVAFGIGAVAGAVTAATGGAATSALGLSAASFAGGAVAGSVGAATGGLVQGLGNKFF